MNNRSAFFLLALLGVLGSGRLADAQPSEKRVPPIDVALPDRLVTATFALG